MKWLLIALTLCLAFAGLSNDTSNAQTDQTQCTFTQTNDFEVELWATPLGGSNGVMMEPNIPYPILRLGVLGDGLPAYEFQIEEGVTGWYEYILLGETNGDCNFGEAERISIAEFPSICEATVTEPTLWFFASSLVRIGRDIDDPDYSLVPEGTRFITIGSNAISAVIYAGHAMYGGTVATHRLEFDPDCPEKVFITTITAQTLDGARLWSNPHVELGEVTANLPINTTIEIMAGPTTSIISTNGETLGDWYLVRNDTYGTGWIWEEYITLSTEFPPEAIDEAVVMADTRVWSQPDMPAGNDLGNVPATTSVNILAGPIDGPTNTNDPGQWYWIRTNNGTITGWVLAEQLMFGDESPLDTTPVIIDTNEFPSEAIGTAFVTANTRIWSLPDVNEGTYLGDIPANTRVLLFDGPIDGAIRTDTDVIGQWYLVQSEDLTIAGWVWAGRLDIQSEED